MCCLSYIGPHYGGLFYAYWKLTNLTEPAKVTSMDTENELVTISVASKKLGVSATALRAWHQAGVIPAVRTPGGHRRFNLEVIRRIIFSEEQEKSHGNT